MREFSIEIKDIFSGLTDLYKDDKNKISLSECHNLIPIKGNYDVQPIIRDLNDNLTTWNGEGEFQTDVWEDEGSDLWTDEGSDVFQDS